MENERKLEKERDLIIEMERERDRINDRKM